MPLAILHSGEAWAEHFGKSGKRTAVTIGNFDGVHLGHQKILQGVLERARQWGLMSAVLTFYPHPARVLRPAQAPALLETLDQRLDAIEAMGIEAALVIQFDAELAKLSPKDFVRRFW